MQLCANRLNFAPAYLQLGMWHEDGFILTLPVNRKRARLYYLRAATMGHPAAQLMCYRLGLMHVDDPVSVLLSLRLYAMRVFDFVSLSAVARSVPGMPAGRTPAVIFGAAIGRLFGADSGIDASTYGSRISNALRRLSQYGPAVACRTRRVGRSAVTAFQSRCTVQTDRRPQASFVRSDGDAADPVS